MEEALLRPHLTLQQGERIESPRAYLSTVVTRLCIDQLRSAWVRREGYVGEWLPEPLVDDGRSDPADHAELADSLSLALRHRRVGIGSRQGVRRARMMRWGC